MFMTGIIQNIEAKIFNHHSQKKKKIDIIPLNAYMSLSLFEQKIIGVSKSISILELDSTKVMNEIIQSYPTIRKGDQSCKNAVPVINTAEVVEEPLPPSQPIQPEPLKKHTFKSNNSSHIKVPPTFSTDNDHQKQVIDYFNEGYDGWYKIDSDKRIEIYQKTNVMPPLVKSYFHVEFSRATIVEAMSNFEKRKKWDEGFSNAVLVEQIEEKNLQQQTMYFYIKSKIPFVEDREMIRLKTTWNNCPNDKTTLIHVTSIEHPNYPMLKKVYRARVIITGYFIEEIASNKCNVGIINQLELGMSDFLMKKVIPKTVYGWYDNVQTGCKYVLSHN